MSCLPNRRPNRSQYAQRASLQLSPSLGVTAGVGHVAECSRQILVQSAFACLDHSGQAVPPQSFSCFRPHTTRYRPDRANQSQYAQRASLQLSPFVRVTAGVGRASTCSYLILVQPAFRCVDLVGAIGDPPEVLTMPAEYYEESIEAKPRNQLGNSLGHEKYLQANESKSDLLREYLIKHPNAKSEAAGKALGIPPPTVRNSAVWKAHQQKMRGEKHEKRAGGRRTRQLTKNALATIPGDDSDPAKVLEEEEQAEISFQNEASVKEKKRFHELPKEDKATILYYWPFDRAEAKKLLWEKA